jgi:dethiobiotin synthetase
VIGGALVIGAAPGAGESDVAEALAAALGEGAAIVVAVPAHAAASPLTAARHAGTEIDPQELVAAVGEAAESGAPVVVSAAGGLLAPLTPRYAVRDVARDIGLPVVLAVPAGPGAVNLARLSLESARAAGLTVAAAVLTDWPDPPDRVLLDERRLLEELAGAPVAVLGGGAVEWPVREWLEAAPAAAAAAPASGDVVLDRYEAWEPEPLGDPRATPRPRIMDAMHAIVAVEGPMTATRACALYNRAAGGRKLTTAARTPLASALYWLSREGRIELTARDEIPWQDDDLVRTPDTPAVHVRELGPRALEEVPLDEIAELMRRLRTVHRISGEERLKRAVLNTYGLVRLTARTDEYLTLALGLAE